MSLKKFIIIVICIALLTLVFSLSFYLGRGKGLKEGADAAKQKLEPLVESIYPKPQAEIKALNGVIKGITDSILGVEVNDPNDYLPHIDGSPIRTQIRTVKIGAKTQIIGVTDDSQTLNLSFSDLKVDDRVTVTSEQNIKDAKEFYAIKIEVAR
ncbi:MAG: hypothetical protein QMD65_03155 [Patescibacteria group bacterium]|nr:hypothetical protein [Patescibacteria group bacterium]